MDSAPTTKPDNSNFSRMLEGRLTAPPPTNDSYIIHSLNREFSRSGVNKGYSIKYVLSGHEHYKVNGIRQVVGPDRFLFVNHGSETEVHIQAENTVEGLCIYLSPAKVADVWNTLHQQHDKLLENLPASGLLPGIMEVQLRTEQVQLGQQVQRLATVLKDLNAETPKLTEELFYGLAEGMCLFQGECLQQMNNLQVQKKTTREELLRRLLRARDFLHDNLESPLTLPCLAEAAMLSEYHFLRSFKAAFGESPYHYLLRQRLELAKKLLAQNKLSVAEVALACGFQEVQAFSKLFRKATGVAPSLYAGHY